MIADFREYRQALPGFGRRICPVSGDRKWTIGRGR
jgi:hypothetical protein